jgi:hypothetical protein
LIKNAKIEKKITHIGFCINARFASWPHAVFENSRMISTGIAVIQAFQMTRERLQCHARLPGCGLIRASKLLRDGKYKVVSFITRTQPATS